MLYGKDRQGVKAGPVGLEHLGIYAAGYVADIHALGLRGDVRRREEWPQRPEILRILPLMPVYLAHAHGGGDVGAVKLQGLREAGAGKGVLEIGQICISKHGEDLG